MKKNLLPLLSLCLVLFASYWSFAPIFIQGFFPVHDDTQVARVQQMSVALLDGMFPVRWVPDLGYGYGYPIFSFYGPFSYYVGAFFMFFGADALIATKLMMTFGILLSGVGMYYLAKMYWGKAGGVVAALLYVYAPYHAVNIYVRGAVGEFFGYAFIPLVFYGVIKAYELGKFRYVAIAGLSYAALLSSHNLTGLMVTPFLVMLLLFLTFFSLRKDQKISFYFMYLSFLFGLLLSAFYWVPALLEMGYTNVISQVGGAADFREHYICLPQLWESAWGYGGSARGCVDGLSFRMGKIHILLAGASLLLLPFVLRKQKKSAIVIVVAFIFLLLSVFFSTDLSKPIWKAVPVLSFIQYPWRFLSVISFFSSFLGGALIWFLIGEVGFIKKTRAFQVLILGVSVGLLVAFYAKLFVPQTIVQKTARDYVKQETLRWDTSRISDEYLPIGFMRPLVPADVPISRFSVDSGNAVFADDKNKTQVFSVNVRAKMQSRIHLNLAYFPGWKVYVDGDEVEYQVEKSGISVMVPPGEHIIEAKYVGTDVENVADMITYISMFGLVTGIIFSWRRRLL